MRSVKPRQLVGGGNGPWEVVYGTVSRRLDEHSPICDDGLGEREKHCKYTVHKGSKDTCRRGSVCSMAKIAVIEEDDEEDSDDERGYHRGH